MINLYHIFFLNKKNISIFLFQKNIPFPTTSFSTATTLIYTYETGITAAAGTKFSLHSLLDITFIFFSFQLF